MQPLQPSWRRTSVQVQCCHWPNVTTVLQDWLASEHLTWSLTAGKAAVQHGCSSPCALAGSVLRNITKTITAKGLSTICPPAFAPVQNSRDWEGSIEIVESNTPKQNPYSRLHRKVPGKVLNISREGDPHSCRQPVAVPGLCQ